MKFTLTPKVAVSEPPPKPKPPRPGTVKTPTARTQSIPVPLAAAVPTVSFATPDQRGDVVRQLASAMPITSQSTTHRYAESSKKRKRLEEVCEKMGYDVGLVRWHKTYDSADTTVTAYIIVGTMYVLQVDGDNLDACYEALVGQLTEGT